MDNKDLSQKLVESLGLEHQPVAVRFSNSDDGLPGPSSSMPAGCSFWELGASKTFSTSTKDHGLCSIGVHTHTLTDAPEAVMEDLKDTLAVMAQMDYVRDSDVAGIPVMKEGHSHVIYGPLSEAENPDAVVLFLDGRQSLLLSEAAERVNGSPAPAMGRPACAAIPQSINSSQGLQSLGCCGARAYNDLLTDQRSMWVLPGPKLTEFTEAIGSFSAANKTLGTFHQIRRKDVEAGGKPSVKESLERMSG